MLETLKSDQLSKLNKDIFNKIYKVAEEIKSHGGRLYLVGGTVRDIIRGYEPKDIDLCVTGLSPQQFHSIFPSAEITGKDFSVFRMFGWEFAFARKERKIGEGYKGFEIFTSPDITIEDDLIRRDITINSIAIDVLTQQIIDPVGGIEDIKKQIIRATSEAFSEDPLRVYRVARFGAELNYTVEPRTIKLMTKLKSELYTLSPERVFCELRKALYTLIPSQFFRILKQAEVLEVHFPEIANLIGVEQPLKYHPEGDAFEHTMIVLDKTAQATKDMPQEFSEMVRFAGLVHDIGKGITPPSLWPKHYGHEKAGIPLVKQMGERLKLPSNWIKAGKFAAEEHMRAGRFYEMTPSKKVKFLEKAAKNILGVKGIEIITQADGKNVRFTELAEEMFAKINGKTLGLENLPEKGPKVGQLIHQARVKWLQKKLQIQSHDERDR